MSENKKEDRIVLVTGASGYVGGRLVPALEEEENGCVVLPVTPDISPVVSLPIPRLWPAMCLTPILSRSHLKGWTRLTTWFIPWVLGTTSRSRTVSGRVISPGYSRQLVWLDREELRTIQTQYFDRRDKHLKTMVVEGYAKYLDRFWRSSKITMTNLLTGKSTMLLWSDYKFGTDLDTNDFTRTALKRIR